MTMRNTVKKCTYAWVEFSCMGFFSLHRMLEDFGNELESTETKIDATMKKIARIFRVNNGNEFGILNSDLKQGLIVLPFCSCRFSTVDGYWDTFFTAFYCDHSSYCVIDLFCRINIFFQVMQMKAMTLFTTRRISGLHQL